MAYSNSDAARASRRVAIVTGASRGLGEIIARVLAERGYDLVLNARDEATLQRAATRLHDVNDRIIAVPVAGDLADPTVRTRIVDEARALGDLQVIVNNASELGGIQPLADVDLARFARVLDVNVIAPVGLIAQALPLLVGGDAPRLIVNVSSDAAQGAYAGWGVYGASKAALDLLTRTLAAELIDRGVASVSVDPGDMRTRMHQEAFPGQDISDRPLPEVTAPFWHWLFDQVPHAVNGERFAAQQEDARWHQPA